MQLSLEDVKDLHKDLETHYKNFHDQCALEDTFCDLEFDVECAEDATPVHLPTAQEAINDAAAQVDTTAINIIVPPRIAKYGADVDADRIRKFLLGCWHMVRQYNGLILHHGGKHGFQYGIIVFKLYAEPAERAPFEIGVANVNPQTFFPDPARRFVIESYQRKHVEILAEYPDAELDVEGEGTWREYWDDTNVIYSIDDMVLVDQEHNYGFLPYFWGDTGLGVVSAKHEPEKLYRGLMYDCHDLLMAESRLYTQSEAIMKQHAWPEKDFISDVLKKAQDVMTQWEDGPGRGHAYSREVEVVRTVPQSPPPEILQLQSLTSELVAKATVPRVTAGERPTGASSGYMTAILSGMARLKFGGVVATMDSMIQQMNVGFLKLVENVFNEITVFGYTAAGEQITETITAEDIAGHYVNFVDISAIPPEEKEKTLMLGLRLLQVGAISKRFWITQYLKPTDPQAEMDQQLIDEVMQLPELRQMLLQKAFQQYEAAEMLKQSGAGDAEKLLRGTAGAAMPPMGGEYSQADRGPAKPTQAGSIEELSQILRAQGAEGMAPHVLDAARSVKEGLKGKG